MLCMFSLKNVTPLYFGLTGNKVLVLYALKPIYFLEKDILTAIIFYSLILSPPPCPSSRMFRLNACSGALFYAQFLQNITLSSLFVHHQEKTTLGNERNSLSFIDIDQCVMFFIVYVEPFSLNLDSLKKRLGFIYLANVPNMFITDHKTKYFCI